jgi:hypothetical protein
MREDAGLRGDGTVRLAGADQIYVSPSGWNEAPWWSDTQVGNLRAILDAVKRTYNVDENHVVLCGVSDGGTGVYYVAMRDTTPYASFLPLNGYVLVLRSEALHIGDVFLNNLRNKPLFVINGGLDPLYPIDSVEPSIVHLSGGGVPIVYRPQPQAGHDTSWLGIAALVQVGRATGEQRGVLDGRRLRLAVEIIRDRDAGLIEVDALVAVPDEDQAVRVRIRQRSEQRLVEQAENGGVRADAERQRQDGDEREDRLPAERTKGVAEVGHGV